ncbi:MAG: H-NS histone family protein [Anaerolineaceae bacterium]|nr:H-NS histone family protein [Anaerolineaceae bacterium]
MVAISESEKLQLHELSLEEVAALAATAAEVLKEKQTAQRGEIVEKIKALAASVGLEVTLSSAGEVEKKPRRSSSTAGTKVPVKYRHPGDANLVWTGRGVKPKWLRKAIDEEGRALEDFAIAA